MAFAHILERLEKVIFIQHPDTPLWKLNKRYMVQNESVQLRIMDIEIISSLVVIYMLLDSSRKARKYNMMRHNMRGRSCP